MDFSTLKHFVPVCWPRQPPRALEQVSGCATAYPQPGRAFICFSVSIEARAKSAH